MPPITRFAAFKYKQGTTDQQKRAWLDGLVSLYAANADGVNFAPKGKKLAESLPSRLFVRSPPSLITIYYIQWVVIIIHKVITKSLM
jgi:hypothetical protein